MAEPFPGAADAPGLLVSVLSFGYVRSGLPRDSSGHGGGFVFDCRCLPNPALVAGLMEYSGLDAPVRAWLDADSGTAGFLARVFDVVDLAANAYLARGYTRLQVCFGCTGGQHRSVYCAERLAEHLRARGARAEVTHSERGVWWE
jgi:RNase adaptor protein for sRNA GlmZ degradation